jgi:hypothetical protein
MKTADVIEGESQEEVVKPKPSNESSE